jgi:hypothetical protein
MQKQHQDDIVLQLRATLDSAKLRLSKWQKSDKGKESQVAVLEGDVEEGGSKDLEIEQDEVWDEPP